MAEDLEFNPFFKALQVRTSLAFKLDLTVSVCIIMMCQGRFFSLYERAQQNCWLICLPTTTSLQTCNISKQFTGKSIASKQFTGKSLSVSAPPSPYHVTSPACRETHLGAFGTFQRVRSLDFDGVGIIISRACSVYKSTGPGNLTWQLNGSELQCMTAGSNGSSSYHVTVIAEELAYNKSLKQFKMFIVDKPLDPSYKVSVWEIVCVTRARLGEGVTRARLGEGVTRAHTPSKPQSHTPSPSHTPS